MKKVFIPLVLLFTTSTYATKLEEINHAIDLTNSVASVSKQKRPRSSIISNTPSYDISLDMKNLLNSMKLYKIQKEEGLEDREREEYLKALISVSYEIVKLRNKPSNVYDLDFYKIPEILNFDESLKNIQIVELLLKHHVDALYKSLEDEREETNEIIMDPKAIHEIMLLSKIAQDKNLLEHERIEQIVQSWREIQKNKQVIAYNPDNYNNEYDLNSAEAFVTEAALNFLLLE